MWTVICCCCCVILAAGQTPPRQTQTQRALVQRVTAQAEKVSAQYEPVLLRALDDADFRANLTRCCPSVANRSAVELLGLLKEELRCAELTHNFNANSSHTW